MSTITFRCGDLKFTTYPSCRFRISRAYMELLRQRLGEQQAQYHLASCYISFLQLVASKTPPKSADNHYYFARSVRKTYKIDGLKVRFSTYITPDRIYAVTAILPDHRGFIETALDDMCRASETRLIEEVLHGEK